MSNMSNDLFFPSFSEEADDLGPLQQFESFEADTTASNDSMFVDDEPAPAFAPWAVGDFAAPAPAMDVSFGVPAPAPAATSAAQWSCPSCNGAMSVFAVSCPCGFSVAAAATTPSTTPAVSAATAAVPPATETPALALSKRAKKATQVQLEPKPSAAAAMATQVNAEPTRSAAATKAERKASSCLEATEARERELRQQLRQVEQNHAVLREYSNLLRKLLASAQVKVSSATNPFNVVGGRPKRLFRCSKGEPHLHRAHSDTDCHEQVKTAAVVAPVPKKKKAPKAPRARAGQHKTRKAHGKAHGCAAAEQQQQQQGPTKRPLPCSFMDDDGSSNPPAADVDRAAAGVDLEHGALLGLPVFDDEGCDGLGDLVLPPCNDAWFPDMPAHKSARLGDKPRADSFSMQNVSPFLSLASAEASW